MLMIFFRPGFFKKKRKKLVVYWLSSPQSCCLEHGFDPQSKPDAFKMFLWQDGLHIFMIDIVMILDPGCKFFLLNVFNFL